MSVWGFSMNAWGETGNASNPHTIKPRSCQEEIVLLQNMLHASNQTIESLVSENRELKETIKKIRDELNRGGHGGIHPTLEKRRPK